ncbi:hypothetical protein B296_00007053 [Ensete ventricosum]|uniref:Uncharacterized protein n=1 Tax=Ensete ventricosum TaxID=4639 RepID=A0A427A8Z3_ENSVE|nr:hypothetical protein B296_00007053 [Ensete ventricosum]
MKPRPRHSLLAPPTCHLPQARKERGWLTLAYSLHRWLQRGCVGCTFIAGPTRASTLPSLGRFDEGGLLDRWRGTTDGAKAQPRARWRVMADEDRMVILKKGVPH